jgi:imidazolonepropionase-like amidohydrolase
MNGQDDFGAIVPGKRADLLLVALNPLDDVANARKILGVMAAGKWYNQKSISEIIDE